MSEHAQEVETLEVNLKTNFELQTQELRDDLTKCISSLQNEVADVNVSLLFVDANDSPSLTICVC